MCECAILLSVMRYKTLTHVSMHVYDSEIRYGDEQC